MAREYQSLHLSTKQLLLQKISNQPEIKRFKGNPDKNPVLQNPALKLLVEDARRSLDSGYTAT